MEEAKETEQKNVASLKKYEQFELEKKKKREKSNVIRKLKPPYVSAVDGPNGKWIVVPDIKIFKKPERMVIFSLFFAAIKETVLGPRYLGAASDKFRLSLNAYFCLILRRED